MKESVLHVILFVVTRYYYYYFKICLMVCFAVCKLKALSLSPSSLLD